MEGFHLKTEEEQISRLDKASEKVEGQLVPESHREEILKMSLDEIKDRFPLRLKMYLKLAKSERDGEDLGEMELSEMKTWLFALNNLDGYIEDHRGNEAERTLRDKQFSVFETTRDFLEQGNKEGYIKLPTGSGKTVIFTEFVESLDLKTLIVVPKKLLVTQTEDELSKFAEDLDVGKIYSDAKEHGDDVTIITYQSLVRGLKDGSINPTDYKCLILDEVHKALGEQTSEAINAFNGALKVGFTATPVYSKDRQVSDLLEKEIYSVSIKEAVQEGMLCGFSVILVESNVDLSSVKVTSTGEYSEVELEKVVNTEVRNKAGVDIYKKMFDGELAVVYCSGVKHAEEMSRLYGEQGIPAGFVSGYQSKKEQERVIESFKEGKIKVLCNADILIEGFDEKKASVCINLKPTLSRVVAEQRAGRVLRLDDAHPDKLAKVVDFIDVYDQGRGALSFVDIAGEALIIPELAGDDKQKSFASSLRMDNTEKSGKPGIRLENFKITTEPREVMRILNELGFMEKEKKEFLPFDQLKKEVREVGIKTMRHYRLEYKNHPGWAMHPNGMYPDQWIGWTDFLDTAFLPFDDFLQEVREAGISSQLQYHQEYSKHPGWHSNPNKFYQDQWKGWGKLWGKEKKEFLAFTSLSEEVQKYNIKSQLHYKQEYSHHEGWPSNPHDVYKDQWKGWDDFLGKKTEFLPFDQLQKEVREAEIKGQSHYAQEYRNHVGWISNPGRLYADQWKGWVDFLGKEKKDFLPFDELYKEVREAGIKSQMHYIREYRNHLGWIRSPNEHYGDQWKGWDVFLDKEKSKNKEFLSLDRLKEEIKSFGIKDRTQYHQERKNRSAWPSRPEQVFGEQWKGWADFLGKV